MLERTYREPANRRLAKHLRHERPYLFTFLYCPGLVDATNNLAERVMRLLVVIRKNWGGNRTGNGARTQAVLTSILCTARQQGQDVFELLTDLLRSPQPKLLDLVPRVVPHGESTAASGAQAVKGAAPKPDRMDVVDSVEIPVLPQWVPPAGMTSFFSSA